MLKERKGFHNRVTRRIRLLPFTLKECKGLLEYNDIIDDKGTDDRVLYGFWRYSLLLSEFN